MNPPKWQPHKDEFGPSVVYNRSSDGKTCIKVELKATGPKSYERIVSTYDLDEDYFKAGSHFDYQGNLVDPSGKAISFDEALGKSQQPVPAEVTSG